MAPVCWFQRSNFGTSMPGGGHPPHHGEEQRPFDKRSGEAIHREAARWIASPSARNDGDRGQQYPSGSRSFLRVLRVSVVNIFLAQLGAEASDQAGEVAGG